MTAAFPEDVAVAIVCHNNRATLAATLESVQDAGCEYPGTLVFDYFNGFLAWRAKSPAFTDEGRA